MYKKIYNNSQYNHYNVKDVNLIFEKQLLHYLLLIILLGLTYLISRTGDFFAGQYYGINTIIWFYLSIAFPVIHQVYVWFCWRTQLHYSLVTRIFGARGFTYYSIGFFTLALVRIIFVVILAISNRNSFYYNQFSLNILAFIIAILAVYLFYSVGRYFKMKRALGIDHFDNSYVDRPLVKEGIYRFVDNGMYLFGVAIIWLPGLVYASKAALLSALFTHLYIWVHYYCTEKPDMKRIYTVD